MGPGGLGVADPYSSGGTNGPDPWPTPWRTRRLSHPARFFGSAPKENSLWTYRRTPAIATWLRAALLGLFSALAVAAACGCGRNRAPKGEPAADRPTQAKGPADIRHGLQRRPFRVYVTAAAFSPDNKYLLTSFNGSPKALTLWEVASGKEVCSLPGHTGSVTGVAFVTGGRQALSASRDGWLLLHDLPTGKLVQSVRAYGESVSELAATPDGQLALTSGTSENELGVLKLWDVEGLRLRRTFRGGGSYDRGIALSPDHKWALQSHPPQVWDLRTGRVAHSLGVKGPWDNPPVRGRATPTQAYRPLDPEWAWNGGVAAFSPDSRLALLARRQAVGQDQYTTRLAVWDFAKDRPPRLLDGEGGLAALFSPTGAEVIGVACQTGGAPLMGFPAGNPLKISRWEVASGQVRHSVDLSPKKLGASLVVFSPDGGLALVPTGAVMEGPDPPPEPALWRRHEPGLLNLMVWDVGSGRLVQQWTRPRAD